MIEEANNPARRSVLVGLGALAAATVLRAKAANAAHVVVVGGGFGGATAARALKRLAADMRVTLIEPNRHYQACPFSNLVIGGVRTMSTLRFDYRMVRAEGIRVIHQTASDINPAKKQLRLSGGETLGYDRLLVAPGIDLKFDAVEGYSTAATQSLPHAWQAGAQTELLVRQLGAMDDGGVVVIAPPEAPYRCPPGPYERASLMAHYLKTHKPRSKLIILDPKDSFSKQPLFEQAWRDRYGHLIEWRGSSDSGAVSRVDAARRIFYTDFDSVAASVGNLIPPQQAGAIAQRTGLTDASGWCPINATSFESLLHADIHVIGDATIAAPMPKSAFSANLQAKVCAIQIIRLLAGQQAEATVLANTCYSYIGPNAAISIAGVYRNNGGVFSNVADAGGLSALDGGSDMRSDEAHQAEQWFSAITGEAFGA